MKRCICGSCIVINEGKVLLLKHKKLGKWMYPGGHMEPEELPIECAERETLEETGLKVKIISPNGNEEYIKDGNAVEMPVPMAIAYETVEYKEGTHMHFDMVYLSVPAGEKRIIANDESEGIRWFDRKEIDEIDTFSNVRSLLLRAMNIYHDFSKH
ncbi:MAG: NUDIX domain-containing protein [Candidatus Marsarchaeota archaeon]|jgi:8-oxo-dGTP pyrophosphatase MutT (NUDIX family)|nr:NUDIX domain-containing protein [Candidatus Marsarchaeota archaeon]